MKIIGWKRWVGGKYHAIMEDHPKNTTTLFTTVTWSACDRYGMYLIDGGLVDNPREEDKCKNCVKKLTVVDKR